MQITVVKPGKQLEVWTLGLETGQKGWMSLAFEGARLEETSDYDLHPLL